MLDVNENSLEQKEAPPKIRTPADEVESEDCSARLRELVICRNYHDFILLQLRLIINHVQENTIGDCKVFNF